MVIIGIMLVIIVPQFASIFASMQKELPGATMAMVAASNFLRSWNLVLLGVGLVAAGWLLKKYYHRAHGKKAFDKLIMRIPFINSLMISKNMAGFFQAISILLQGGMPLVKAVHIAKESIENNVIKEKIDFSVQEINAGITLADALASCDQLCGQDMISLIKVGQESGQLANMLGRVAEILSTAINS